MENAGCAVADHVLAHYSSAQRIVVFCGKGNNGGDGFVAARKLQERGKKVRVTFLADPADLRGDADAMYRKLPMQPVAVHSGGGTQSRGCIWKLTCTSMQSSELGSSRPSKAYMPRRFNF